MDQATITAIADAIAERLRPLMPPPGWPEGRGCLSEAECAAYLAIGAEFLADLRKSGRIAWTAQGRRVTYSPGNVAQWLEKCQRNGDSQN